jgi:alpha-tubulin suppressor-like RCC1 family protein
LWTWGENVFGQLGLNNTTYYSSPKQVGSGTNWASVYCGQRHTLSIKTDGTLWAWGFNSTGQLGLGNTTYYSSPKQVGSLTNWSKISAGLGISTSIKTDGTLWTWGRNNVGQLGLGDTTQRNSPVQVGALTTWYLVSAGLGVFAQIASIKTDGTLWIWGGGGSGKLGLGNITNYSSPKQVGALTSWLAITTSYDSTFGIAVN